MKKFPGLFKIGSRDLIKGAIMAVLAAVSTGAIEILTGMSAVPPVYPNMQTVSHLLVAGLTTGLIYIMKNFLTNSDDKFLKAEEPKADA